MHSLKHREKLSCKPNNVTTGCTKTSAVTQACRGKACLTPLLQLHTPNVQRILIMHAVASNGTQKR